MKKTDLMTMTAAMMFAASGYVNADTPANTDKPVIGKQEIRIKNKKTYSRGFVGNGTHRKFKRIPRWKADRIHRILLQCKREQEPHCNLCDECRRHKQFASYSYCRQRG